MGPATGLILIPKLYVHATLGQPLKRPRGILHGLQIEASGLNSGQ